MRRRAERSFSARTVPASPRGATCSSSQDAKPIRATSAAWPGRAPWPARESAKNANAGSDQDGSPISPPHHRIRRQPAAKRVYEPELYTIPTLPRPRSGTSLREIAVGEGRARLSAGRVVLFGNADFPLLKHLQRL